MVVSVSPTLTVICELAWTVTFTAVSPEEELDRLQAVMREADSSRADKKREEERRGLLFMRGREKKCGKSEALYFFIRLYFAHKDLRKTNISKKLFDTIPEHIIAWI